MLYLPRDFNFDKCGALDLDRIHFRSRHLSRAGINCAFKIAMSAVAWFTAVVWLNLEGAHVDSRLAVGAGIFVVSLTLLLVFGSTAIDGRHCACAKR